MVKVAVVGASGYAGAQLCRIISRHEKLELTGLFVSENSLDKGKNILISGYFKAAWKEDTYEFKVQQINLLETVKQTLTKQIDLSLKVGAVSNEVVDFIEKNVKSYPGKIGLKINLIEPSENLKITLANAEKGFTMNDEMAFFLMNNPDIEVSVALNT